MIGKSGSLVIRRSRMSRRRAAVLLGVYALMALHILHWKLAGETLTPVEPSEAMQTLERGRINAGFVFFAITIVATLVFGRLFCGWACHVVALQDACGALMKRIGIKPRPFRSRLLAWIPAVLAFYMFVWPTFRRDVLAPVLERVWPAGRALIGAVQPFPGFSMHLVEGDFWQTFPSVAVAIPFLLICGFAVVYFLGAKGFCTYGCPYGAVFGAADRLAPAGIVVDLDACQRCGHCTATCTSNVRVHEEIRAHGRVVDSGCMKCMDCVSVCPTGALSYRPARPSFLARRRVIEADAARRVKRPRYDLSWRAEIALGSLFALAFFAFRGAYGFVPMLMAVGIGLVVVHLAWTLWRLATTPDVALHRIALKSRGRLARAGRVIGAVGLFSIALSLHTGLVSFHRWRGESLDRGLFVTRADLLAGSIDPSARERAVRARTHYTRARGVFRGGIGIFDTPEIAVRTAWLDLVAGEPARARATLERLRESRGSSDLLIAELGAVLALEGRREEAERLYARELEEHPGYTTTRLRLARLHAEAGRIDDAVSRYREHLAERPTDAATRATLASALLAGGRANEAVVELRRAIADEPGRASLRHDLAVALFVGGDTLEALAAMREAAALDPNDRSIAERLREMERQAHKK